LRRERRRSPRPVSAIRRVLAVLCQAIAKGVITATDIRRALARYVASDGYRPNIGTGTGRLDLVSKIVGVVELRKAARLAKSGLAPTKNGPRTAGSTNGPISANVIHRERSTPGGADASPAA
jgi:hypothetical protein